MTQSSLFNKQILSKKSIKLQDIPVIDKEKKHSIIQRALWGKALWSSSYFSASCWGASLNIVQQQTAKYSSKY